MPKMDIFKDEPLDAICRKSIPEVREILMTTGKGSLGILGFLQRMDLAISAPTPNTLTKPIFRGRLEAKPNMQRLYEKMMEWCGPWLRTSAKTAVSFTSHFSGVVEVYLASRPDAEKPYQLDQQTTAIEGVFLWKAFEFHLTPVA